MVPPGVFLIRTPLPAMTHPFWVLHANDALAGCTAPEPVWTLAFAVPVPTPDSVLAGLYTANAAPPHTINTSANTAGVAAAARSSTPSATQLVPVATSSTHAGCHRSANRPLRTLPITAPMP